MGRERPEGRLGREWVALRLAAGCGAYRHQVGKWVFRGVMAGEQPEVAPSVHTQTAQAAQEPATRAASVSRRIDRHRLGVGGLVTGVTQNGQHRLGPLVELGFRQQPAAGEDGLQRGQPVLVAAPRLAVRILATLFPLPDRLNELQLKL